MLDTTVELPNNSDESNEKSSRKINDEIFLIRIVSFSDDLNLLEPMTQVLLPNQFSRR